MFKKIFEHNFPYININLLIIKRVNNTLLKVQILNIIILALFIVQHNKFIKNFQLNIHLYKYVYFGCLNADKK